MPVAQNKSVARLCAMLRADSTAFQADGRVLRLKQVPKYYSSSPFVAAC